MNVYGGDFISGRNAKLLNIILIILGISLLGWNVRIWMKPSVVPSTYIGHEKKAAVKYVKKGPVRRTAYNRIVTEDLFRASRKPYAASATTVAVKKVVQSRVPVAAPKLKLLGTVILDNGKAAIISDIGPAQETKSYKVGENIGGFEITTITENSVILTRGTESLEIIMNDNSKSAAGAKRGWKTTTRSLPQPWQRPK